MTTMRRLFDFCLSAVVHEVILCHVRPEFDYYVTIMRQLEYYATSMRPIYDFIATTMRLLFDFEIKKIKFK